MCAQAFIFRRLLRTNFSARSFVENINQFKARLRVRDYPNSLVQELKAQSQMFRKEVGPSTKTESAGKISAFRNNIPPGCD